MLEMEIASPHGPRNHEIIRYDPPNKLAKFIGIGIGQNTYSEFSIEFTESSKSSPRLPNPWLNLSAAPFRNPRFTLKPTD